MSTTQPELPAAKVPLRDDGKSLAVSASRIQDCIEVLEALVDNRAELAEIDLETRNRLLIAAGRVSRPERTEQKRLARALLKKERVAAREVAEAQLSQSQIRKKRLEPVFITPPPRELPELSFGAPHAPGPQPSQSVENVRELEKARVCYVCKKPYARLHFFYDQLCTECGDFNHQKRSPKADLSGRVALITGARVKIGYQAAILLLRAGARVIVSTRFPNDAARRYAAEADYQDWADRLQIWGLDLRHTPSVEHFARQVTQSESRLDFVIHNACQTVRRPAGFYSHLMEGERRSSNALPETERRLLTGYESLRAAPKPHRTALQGAELASTVGLHAPSELSQLAVTEEDRGTGTELFPGGQLDADLQQVDLRVVNSWRLPLDQVSTVELIEVQLVNAIAPFVLNARLKPLMLRERTSDKHIVNVSAMEGQFYRRFKTDMHPHTNMAKAALNMMTRTSASDYVKDGIHMNSVDTGWITDEDPAHIALRKTEENGFYPPLDIVDGAARIVDPIFSGFATGEHPWGVFFKDYFPTAW